jgi:hypothetical protein
VLGLIRDRELTKTSGVSKDPEPPEHLRSPWFQWGPFNWVAMIISDVPTEYVDLPIYHEELAAALGFTAADLEANRAGRLSAAQRSSWFRQYVYRSVSVVTVVALVAAGCIVIAFEIGIGASLSWSVLALAALLLVAAGYFGVVAFQLSEDLNGGIVSSVEGFVQPYVKVTNIATGSYGPGMPVWTFYWLVDDQRFAVYGKAYGVLTPARHRLYFLPRTRRVVSAEPSGTGQSAGLSPSAATTSP